MIAKSRKQRLVAEINITPFTDVILVLLVIFMITTPLISESSLKVKLPEAKSGTPNENKNNQQAKIVVTAEGLIYLDGKIVRKGALREKINALYRENPELSVILSSDRMVKFKDVVVVLDILSELGITRLNIAATNQ